MMEQQLSGFVGSRYVVCYEFINYKQHQTRTALPGHNFDFTLHQ